jgi:hypothetical protein
MYIPMKIDMDMYLYEYTHKHGICIEMEMKIDNEYENGTRTRKCTRTRKWREHGRGHGDMDEYMETWTLGCADFTSICFDWGLWDAPSSRKAFFLSNISKIQCRC